ncbi:phytanoyl-CoA dioxygenase family protein [Sphingomonas immobilis]|uniref:Phytanoyl-CoA dioxygenase family protein n=1 Tax=Sphingomonas immobilis TaxID=3063997 RepID=A0ABT8ZU94_9SPHN|nr:phytanoyl-CoA dioxygenase family protein [Sphingomonas sp. CA1-15]MDO7840782.1 phytanoyl-CoA dioxygenase family protein [Sphingomonas sp. CA1-15]
MATATIENDTFLSGLVSQADLDFFRAKGAICIRGVVDLHTVERARAASAEVIEARLAALEAQGQPRHAGPQFHHMIRVADEHPVLHDILVNSKLPLVARDLMQSRKVIVFGDSLFDKEPGALTKTPWHHDQPYWPVRGEQVCSTWLALDAVTRENGGLEYVAGSHRWNRWFRPKFFNGTESSDTRFETIPDFDADRDDYEILHWELEPGDVLIHQGLTVHGAGENTRLELSRRAYAPRYVGEETWWDPEFHSSKGNPKASVLEKGDPLDRHGIHEVALEV